MLDNTVIASIGVGNMGGAIVEAWLNKKIVQEDKLLLFDAHKESFNTISVLSPDKAMEIKKAKVILLAVKPQILDDVAMQYGHYLKNTFIISILAGTRLEELNKAFPSNTIVRWMPNMALKVDSGVLGYYNKISLTDGQKKIHTALMSVFKVQKRMDSQKELDVVTALSGSAPAFYYVFARALEEVALKYGYNRSESFELTKEVFVGSAKLFEDADLSFKDLNAKIASKGGTTQAALASFRENNLSTLVEEAVDAAVERAEKLSNS